MRPHVQMVGRVAPALKRRVRAAAKRRQVSLNTLLIDALTEAVGRPRRGMKAGAPK